MTFKELVENIYDGLVTAKANAAACTPLKTAHLYKYEQISVPDQYAVLVVPMSEQEAGRAIGVVEEQRSLRLTCEAKLTQGTSAADELANAEALMFLANQVKAWVRTHRSGGTSPDYVYSGWVESVEYSMYSRGDVDKRAALINCTFKCKET